MHISEFTTEELYVAIVRRAKAIMADAGITADDLQMNHIVSHTHVRNAKIRSEYQEQVTLGVKGDAVIAELVERYGLSYAMIVSIVYNRR